MATDVSEEMLAVARRKCGENAMIQVEKLDFRQPSGIGKQPIATDFDGALSNFGAMNCLREWRTLAEWLAKHVKTGGIVGLGIMSPLCIWEPIWHGLHRDFKTATRRWHRNSTFKPTDLSETIDVTYPTIRRITHDFEPYFRRIYVRPIGLFLPPSDGFGVIEKRSGLLRLLVGLDDRFGKYSKLALFADHYWIEFERNKQVESAT
jgi:hypothetical protein